MRVLITGASGFIGSYLTSHLQDRHELYTLGRRKPHQIFSERINQIEQDLAQPLDHAQLPDQIDTVIYLAQSRFYRQFPEQAVDMFQVNIQSVLHLLEYARQAGAKNFIFASSGGVYGTGSKKFVETDPVCPPNFYLSSKYAAELLIKNYQPFFHTSIFRFFFVYGPGQQGMLMPTLLTKVQRGEPITIEGQPGLRINPIYVEDAVRAFEPAMHLSHSDLFNIAGNEVETITGLVQLMGQVAGRQVVIDHTDAKTSGDLVGDNTKMKDLLGVQPKTTLYEGLSRLIEADRTTFTSGH
jgi:nucleoside-diphosphate-sugar epimerase